MINLTNKLKKIKKSQIAEAIPYIVAGSILLFGCNDKEKQKISKYELKGFVEFDDGNGGVYTDLDKDDKLDIFENTKEYPIVTAIEIVENINDETATEIEDFDSISGEVDYFRAINRKSYEAITLQKKFELVKQKYEKQENKK